MQDSNITPQLKFAFFGTSRFSVIFLDELKNKGFVPDLIVTTEDKPSGRKLILTPPPVKVWAEKEKIKYIQPEKFDDKELALNFDLFIVASYGKMIPVDILDIPKYRTLNIHPSLLPKLRGASPMQSAILLENETGVTVIRLDEKMDHGPIIAQKKIEITEWPPYSENLEEILAKEGANLLLEILPDLVEGKTKEVEQDHQVATFCKKIKKTDGEISLDDNPEKNLRKIRAYQNWPGTYFFQDGKRIIIKTAHIENDKLLIERIIPEGKKEMSYIDFLKGKN